VRDTLLRWGALINLLPRHPGERRDPVIFVQRTEMRSRWVPDIASRFRDDEQKSELPGTSQLNVFFVIPAKAGIQCGDVDG
jgi:hypothetical protein